MASYLAIFRARFNVDCNSKLLMIFETMDIPIHLSPKSPCMLDLESLGLHNIPFTQQDVPDPQSRPTLLVLNSLLVALSPLLL